MNKSIILISGSVVQERLEEGVKDVNYLVRVSGEMKHSNNGQNGSVVAFNYEVYTLDSTDAEAITNEQFDSGMFGLLAKGGQKSGMFELRGFDPEIDFSEDSIEEIQVKLNELYFLNFCNSKAIYGINNWIELE